VLFVEPLFLFLFLPLAVIVIRSPLVSSSPSASSFWIFATSLLFYATWDLRSIPFLCISIFFNFRLSKRIWELRLVSKERLAQRLLVIGLLLNLGALAYSKYWISMIEPVLRALFGLDLLQHSPWFPVGISFFTFTQIAYLVDCRRGNAETTTFIPYATFVIFFPHLVAGPVLRHSETIPELIKAKKATTSQVVEGCQLLISGIVRKALIADPLGAYIQPYFKSIESGGTFNTWSAWILILCFGFQLYFDFSGYSMMAIGIARMLGYQVPINFDAPYRSIGIIDFWRRWHMSLSAFLRDYLYIPLGGSREGLSRQYRNLMITMILGGLWHGSTINFALWGLFHGVLLVAEHDFRRRSKFADRQLHNSLTRILGILITFVVVLFTWVPFRLENLMSIVRFWGSLLGVGGEFHIQNTIWVVLPLLLGAVMVLSERRARTLPELAGNLTSSPRVLVGYGVGLMVALVASGSTVDFLYARF
jgi:alginate O-acetyltransferase complex protein AlgI